MTPISNPYVNTIKSTLNRGRVILQSHILNTKLKKQVFLGALGFYATICICSLAWRTFRGDYYKLSGCPIDFKTLVIDVISHVTFYTVIKQIASIFRRQTKLGTHLRDEPEIIEGRAAYVNFKGGEFIELQSFEQPLDFFDGKGRTISDYNLKCVDDLGTIITYGAPDIIFLPLNLSNSVNDLTKKVAIGYNYETVKENNNECIFFRKRSFLKIGESKLKFNKTGKTFDLKQNGQDKELSGSKGKRVEKTVQETKITKHNETFAKLRMFSVELMQYKWTAS